MNKPEYKIPTFLPINDSTRGLRGDEWNDEVRAIVFRCATCGDKAEDAPLGTLAEFNVTLNVENVSDFLRVSQEKGISVHGVQIIWHNPDLSQPRDVDQYGAPKGSFASRVSIWDADNNRHVYAIKCSDRYYWADRRFAEFKGNPAASGPNAKKRSSVRLFTMPSGIPAGSTKPAESAA